MPSIPENLAVWGDPVSWQRRGEEWSDSWGDTTALWLNTLQPRIGRELPVPHLLEIACGRGRVTEFLLRHCTRYTGVDLVPACVEACRQRFRARPDAGFHVTDGRTLPMVADASVDFAVSWDSLVHADHTVLAGYLEELARTLRPGARAFLHHSNLGAYVDREGRLTVDDGANWRDPTVSADTVAELCRSSGLVCESQELVQWGKSHHGDCFSVVRRPATAGAPHPAHLPRRFENPHFREEVGYSRIQHAHYRRTDDGASAAT